MRRWGRLEVGWPVSRLGSSDYGKCVPHLGSTQIQDVAEDQWVRRQKGEPKRGTKKNKKRGTNKEEPNKKNHPPVSREN